MAHAQIELAAEGRLQARGEQRAGDAFAGNVGQQQPQAAGTELQKIVIIAADFPRRHAPAAIGRGLQRLRVLRKQALLNVPGDLQIAPGVFSFFGEIGLFFDGGQQARVVPGLLDEIGGAAAHGFDREIHARPRRHHDDRRRSPQSQQLVEQVESFVAGGGVARIIHVHQDQVESAALGGGQRISRRVGGFRLMARAFEEQTNGFEHIGLIVAYQDPH